MNILNPDLKSCVISAVEMAAVSNVSNLTADRIVALTGGHGMVNMAVHTVANVITEELLGGKTLSIEFADVRRLPVEDVMQKAIDVAKASGADGANAALIVASIMYLAGSKAQVGIPAGNRKLGATARMLAGVDRSGVAAVPTPKMNSKVSGFPAVMAIYQAAAEGKLTSYDGRKVPQFIAGGPLYGHSALGEDFIWPELAENGARIGTQAMMDAMAGTAILPHPFTAAVIGAAAILEIIHPDAEVPEEKGAYGRTSSAYLVGKSASQTAGLPEKLHLKVTKEEYDTAQLIGDLGLIIKDIGGPSVIGMMAFDEIFSIFEEMIAGFSGTPINPPIGHIGGYAILGMKALLEYEGDMAKVAELIATEREGCSLDPETAMLSINTIARKANELHSGPITQMLIEATEPRRAKVLHEHAEYAYDQLKAGKALTEIVKEFEANRVERVETNANRLLSGMLGAPVSVKILKMEPGARRTTKLSKKYLAFDPLVDISITVGENTAVMENFAVDILPAIVRGERDDVAWSAPIAGVVLGELILASVNNTDAVIPAAVAAAMKLQTPEEAGAEVELAATYAAGIPGTKAAATSVAKLALRIVEY